MTLFNQKKDIINAILETLHVRIGANGFIKLKLQLGKCSSIELITLRSKLPLIQKYGIIDTLIAKILIETIQTIKENASHNKNDPDELMDLLYEKIIDLPKAISAQITERLSSGTSSEQLEILKNAPENKCSLIEIITIKENIFLKKSIPCSEFVEILIEKINEVSTLNPNKEDRDPDEIIAAVFEKLQYNDCSSDKGSYGGPGNNTPR